MSSILFNLSKEVMYLRVKSSKLSVFILFWDPILTIYLHENFKFICGNVQPFPWIISVIKRLILNSVPKICSARLQIIMILCL